MYQSDNHMCQFQSGEADSGEHPVTLIQWPDNDHTCVGETQSRYDIMVCYDLEAILARVKISPCVHCTATVQ